MTLVSNNDTMIVDFDSKHTYLVWIGERSTKLPFEIQNTARRKLRMLHRAQDLNDLRIPPSNHLEKLKGNLIDYFSIRINNQWRIIFKWKDGNSYKVKIVDYH